MRGDLEISVTGGILAVSVLANTVLDIVTALSLPPIKRFASLTAFFYLAFAFQPFALACLTYFYLFSVKQTGSTSQKHRWLQYWAGVCLNTAAVLLTFSALVWLAVRQSEMQEKLYALVAAGFTFSILCIMFHVVFFTFLYSHTKSNTASSSVPRLTITHTGTQPPMMENRGAPRSSFGSRDPTLASRACTPTSSRTYSLHSATTKVGTSIRSKIGKGRGSARSSLEIPALPGSERRSTSPNAFDRYDTSNIDPETRNTILTSSPPLNRSALDTIPGSRMATPNQSVEKVLGIPPIPTSNPQTPASSSKASKPHSFDPPSSPPSSPPNFSRPTSKHQNKVSMTGLEPPPRISASMTDLIHPLFRPDSPSPPQILTSGTMVTASPLANQPITPKTLSRLRSDSHLRHKASYSNATIASPTSGGSKRQGSGQWRTMPNVEANYAAVMAKPRPRSKSHSSTIMSKRPSMAGSFTDVTMSMTDVAGGTKRLSTREEDLADSTDAIVMVGSPGPSIADVDGDGDVDLPPILPGFVLSAGARTSLVGYGKRKSMKSRGSQQL